MERERYRKYATMELAFKARLRGERELVCIFWGRWRELMRVWNYMMILRHEVKRRTFLLDEVREKYLKDVMAVKAALAQASKKVQKHKPYCDSIRRPCLLYRFLRPPQQQS